MIRQLREKIDYEYPHFLYHAEPQTYWEFTCDKCGAEADALYELDGYEVCVDCLCKATCLTAEYA